MWLILYFKVIFVWKYSKIIYFNFLKFIFNIKMLKRRKNTKKNYFKQKYFLKF
jgi:hypothetical protein